MFSGHMLVKSSPTNSQFYCNLSVIFHFKVHFKKLRTFKHQKDNCSISFYLKFLFLQKIMKARFSVTRKSEYKSPSNLLITYHQQLGSAALTWGENEHFPISRLEWHSTDTKWKCEPWMQDGSMKEWAGERRGIDMRYEEIISQTDHAVMLKTKLIA